MKQVETTRTRTNRWTISLNGPGNANDIEQHRFRLVFLMQERLHSESLQCIDFGTDNED